MYDISSHRERYKVHKVLKGYGRSIQKSVFLCRCTGNDNKTLISKLEKLNLSTGYIIIYRLTKNNFHKIIGKPANDTIENEYSYIV